MKFRAASERILQIIAEHDKLLIKLIIKFIRVGRIQSHLGGDMLKATKAIVVCGDGVSRRVLGSLIANLKGIESVKEFDSPAPALEYARDNPVAFAALDIGILEADQFNLDKKLKEMHPNLAMVYINRDSFRLLDVMRERCDYCFMISFNQEDVQNMVREASCMTGGKKVRAVMFGRFQFFVRGRLVYFANAKAKELLALCLDHRGGEVSMEEAVDKLWPDRVYDDKVKKLYRKAVTSLQTVLREADAEDIFVTRRGACYVNIDEIECDYYSFLENRDRKNCLYDGSYLFDYEWGEETLALLERIATDLTV